MKKILNVSYEEWLERVESNGAILTEYPCPGCGFEIKALVPDEGDQYDSMTTCPSCLQMHFKVVDSDGTVHINENDPRETIGYCEKCGKHDHHRIDELCPGCQPQVETIGTTEDDGYKVGEPHPAT